ncbi:hypothetical protein M8371_28775, partial [Klebsiella pneumoniae]|nr:hypothetical protein [Klebsiella pneumoniae]
TFALPRNGLRCREGAWSVPSTQQKFDLFNKAPGNVRELRNEAERFVLGIKSTITMGDISSDISSFSLMQTVEYFERGLIATELARHAGSLSRTAESLQVAKSTLSDKIKKYGLKF